VPGVQRHPAEHGADKGGLARPVGSGDRDPVGPVDLQVDRPQGEVAAAHHRAAQGRHHRAGPGRRGDLHAQLPLLARLVDHLQPLDQALGLAGLGGLLLGLLGAELLTDLVVVRRLAVRVAHPLLHPGTLRARTLLQAGADLGVVLVLLAGVAAGHLPLLQVRLVAAAVRVDLVLGEVELDHPGDGAGEELPVVADQHGGGSQVGDEPLQPAQAVQVEVVGRLVEQHHVVPAEQQ
jgi:hypothetical protein